ncbi:MAG TPA: hypothetical protein VF857_11530 [Spirochaetota bacterium]
MKLRSTLLILASVVAVGTTDLFAGSIDYLSNQSADYTRTFSRNASTDGDSVLYNPAGTAFMKEGIYVYGANQFVFKNYENDLNTPTFSKKYKTDEPTLLLPSGTAIYKAKDWAAFLGGSVVAGGGKVVYDSGIPTFVGYPNSVIAGLVAKGQNQALANGAVNNFLGQFSGDGKLTATSCYPAFVLGGSYAFADMVSVSLSGRFVDATKTYKGYAVYSKAGRLNLDAEEKAQGFGGIIGVDLKPIQGLLIAARYETKTKLNFKTTINDGKDFEWKLGTTTVRSFFIDGEKRRKDLPAMLALGTSYTIEKLTVTASYEYFFIKQADQDKDTPPNGSLYDNGYNDHYKNGWEGSVSIEYAVIPEFLKLSIGGMYDKVGGNKNTYNDFDFSLDSKSIGAGGRITPIKNFDVIFGVSHTFYKSAKDLTGSTTFKKQATVVAIGGEYKI